MPIEIKELHIKVTINAEQQDRAGADQAQTSQRVGAAGKLPDTNEIVSESVEQVLEVLRNKKER